MLGLFSFPTPYMRKLAMTWERGLMVIQMLGRSVVLMPCDSYWGTDIPNPEGVVFFFVPDTRKGDKCRRYSALSFPAVSIWTEKLQDATPSMTSKRHRTAANPPKFTGAAWHMHTAPQKILEVSLLLSLIINTIQIYSHANTNKTYQWKLAHEIDKRPFRDELPYSN